MTPLALRKINTGSVALRDAVADWRATGMAIDFYDPATVGATPGTAETPRQDARYIAFHADADAGNPGWDGLVQCDEWLANAMPALAALALPDDAGKNVLDLFTATPRPLSSVAAFPYRALTVTGLVAGADLMASPLAVLHTQEAKVWLRALPTPGTAAPFAIGDTLRGIPATLQFLLGASRLSGGRLSRVVPGDVLLVTDHALRMRCNGLVLGWYSITEKGITVDEMLNQPYEDLAGAALQAAPEAERSSTAQDGMARIPVRLEFVLQQNTMSMGELGRLHGGQVLDLTPDAEKSVLVLANGALLGRGELVQLEDRLGVEVIEIYGGADRAD